MKTCTKCKETKELNKFYKDNHTKDGYKTECIDCRKIRYKELKVNPIKQMQKLIKSSVIIENQLLTEKEQRVCSGCKNIFNISELLNSRLCKNCMKEYRIKKDLNSYYREYRKNKKPIVKDKERRDKLSYKEYHKEYMRKYRLNQKLEKEQQKLLSK